MKEIIFIELNRTAEKAMNIAYELGFDIHFFTSNIDLYSQQSCLTLPSFVDNIHIVNTNDINDILSYINESNVAGVFHFTEKNLLIASQVAEHLELMHSNLDGIHYALDKGKCRKYLLNQKVKQPTFQIFKSQEFPLTCPIKFPCIVKPVNTIRNAGTKICYNDNEFQEMISFLSIKQPIMKGNIFNGSWILEEYIEGPEYCGEFIWDGNQWVLLGYAAKTLTSPPYSVDMGFQFPTKLPQNIDENIIKNTLISWIHKIGLDWGTAQVVFKIIDNEAILMGINPSLGDERIIELIESSLQFDVIRYLVKATANLTNPDIINLKQQSVFNNQFIPTTVPMTN